MRIALLTFHHNNNYGAVLQAYSTASVLRGLGHEVVIPHFVPHYHRQLNSPLRGWGIGRPGFMSRIQARAKRAVRQMLASTNLRVRAGKFDRFRAERLRISKPLESIAEVGEILSGCDACIVGSDQVWNLNLMRQYEGLYFIDFEQSVSCRRISYAACFGQPTQPKALFDRASGPLSRFQAVGVRNDFSAELFFRATGRVPTVVVDPTMLCSFEDLRSDRLAGGDYILVYTLNGHASSVLSHAVLDLKQKTGYRVICIDTEDALRVAGVGEYRATVGPEEWVSAIKSAAHFITDSFHGCVFAAKFGTPLTACIAGWRSARLVDFLTGVGLESAIVSEAGGATPSVSSSATDWHKLSMGKVSTSLEFLKAALAS